MKRKQRLLLAINAVTEMADELMRRHQDEIDNADYLTREEIRETKGELRSGMKEIETVWRNGELLKKLLGSAA